MKLASVDIRCFRSLANVQAKMSDYSSLIGKNDSGKSSFLRALQMLFDPTIIPSDNDRCHIGGQGEEWYIEGTLSDCSPSNELAINGKIRIRRLLQNKGNTWQYMGQIPSSPALSAMRTGVYTKGAYQDCQLPRRIREIVDSVLSQAPSGRVPPEVWKDAFERVEDAGLVQWEEGWCDLAEDQLGSLVVPIMLEADVRVEEEISDRGRSLFGQIGGLLVSEATQRHAGLQDAVARLQNEIDSISSKDEAGNWQLDELNRLEAVLSEEIGRFDEEVRVEHDLQPPRIPSLDFSVRVDVSDEWVSGLANMGHGLRRSVVFSMLRTLRRIRELRASPDGHSEGPSPLYLFLIEEPELYLHPQAERRRMRELQELSRLEDTQVVLCTHSAFFVDLAEYKGIVRFDRPHRNVTHLHQWKGDDLGELDAKTLKTTYAFDPTRAAMLFADLAILVEGQTEKVTVPALAERMGLSTTAAEVVDCGGNSHIPIYQTVLEALDVKYVAWLDTDDGDPIKKVTKARTKGNGRIVLTEGNWEKMANLPKSKDDKAFRSWRIYVFEARDPNEATEARIRAAYTWEDYPRQGRAKHREETL